MAAEARAEEMPENAQERIQRNFEARAAREVSSKEACNSKAVLKRRPDGKRALLRIIKTARGGYTNKCPDCNAIRYPNEKHSVCCQNAKVRLQSVPPPPPILITCWKVKMKGRKFSKNEGSPRQSLLAWCFA